MLGAIARFEVRYQLRQPLFWSTTAVLALLTFGAVTSDTVSIGGAIGNVHRNSPFVIMQFMTVLSVVGMFVITAFVASSVQRDFEHGTAPLFFSRPIKKRDYLLGRFAGSFAVSALVFLGPLLAIVLGSFMPWLEPERLGPFRLAPYAFTFFVLVLPNLIFVAAVFFALAAVTRSLLATYLGVVVFMVVYLVSAVLLEDIENHFAASLLDPFGGAAIDLATRYWTVVEKNTALPDLAEGLLWNRVVWIGVGLLALAAGYVAFDPARDGGRLRRRRRALPEDDAPLAAASLAAAFPTAAQDFSARTAWRQFFHQARLEVVGVLRSIPFLVMVAFGCVNVLASVSFGERLFGTSTYPVTHLMLQHLEGSYVFLLVIIVIFFAGELIWKERGLGMHEVYDALPTPTWTTLAAKLAGLATVVLVFLGVGALAMIGFQAWQGHFRFEPGLYAKGLLISGVYFLLAAVLAVFLQVAANSKFLGYLLMILYLVSAIVLDSLDFDHYLYRYGGTPDMPYSDMNGYGHFVVPFLWFALYWSCVALVLYGLAILLRVRGTEPSWRHRLRQAAARFRGPVRWAVAAGLAGAVATGAFIFWNTNVRNAYVPGDEQERRQAEYEKRYRQYMDMPMPRIVAVRTEVDIFPETRRMEARGHYRLQNRTARPIGVLHLNLDPRVEVKALRFRPHRLVRRDAELGYSIYRLDRPLQPGEEMALDFEVAVQERGFVNGGSDTSLVANGTFFNNRQYFPLLGYDEDRQLVDRNLRREHGLPPVRRMPRLDDRFARRNTYLGRDADWIDFETVVSTSPGQIALAPGYLQREWKAGGRRYFHYAMDAPILHFYSYLSADWAVRRDRWRDVAIEVYYHPPHGYNVERMVDGVKRSLDYFTAEFGPYQHRQVRILEFPRYARFAQSFPNTIPYSEDIGFIARVRDAEEDIDYPFYVTAHEVAHQWWAHQVIGGNVQGATMLSETLSQYSALMVMEKEYGARQMRRFLKYELDRYLSDRGGELVEELPLMRVEGQPYIHYRKGSVAMYALKDAIGEAALNAALRRFVTAKKFQRAPFTYTRELMAELERATPPDRRALLADLFETITLFENRVTTALATRRADGKFAVDLTVEAKKLRADGQGVETQVALDDWIDVGVFAGEEKGGAPGERVLYLAKHHVTAPTTKLRLTVAEAPTRAGIDPYNKLVDRNSEDNLKRVEGATGRAAGR